MSCAIIVAINYYFEKQKKSFSSFIVQVSLAMAKAV